MFKKLKGLEWRRSILALKDEGKKGGGDVRFVCSRYLADNN